MKIQKNNSIRKVYLALTLIVVAVGILLRLALFELEGGDHPQYKRALLEFERGINPYKYTVKSFENEDLEHGYAYFPTLLYVLTAFWQINKAPPQIFQVPFCLNYQFL